MHWQFRPVDPGRGGHEPRRKGAIPGLFGGIAANGAPNPLALDLLRREGIDTGFARSKSWDEFGKDGAPQMDFVFPVCDSAAAEECPFWPGQP